MVQESRMAKYILVGAAAAIKELHALVDEACSSGWNIEVLEFDPSGLESGFWGRMLSKFRLRSIAKSANEGVLILVERQGDSSWQPWMVYAAGAGLGQIAVPMRLKGRDNIAEVRSGVAVYSKIETTDDLDEIFRSTRNEVQKLAYVGHF